MATRLPFGARSLVMVGFGQAVLAHLDDRVRPGAIVVIEDPDVIEKRSVHAEAKRLRCVAGVVAAPYHADLSFVGAVESYLGGARADVVLAALEYGVTGAAALAARWGLPGASVRASRCLTDKLRLREAAAAAGLRNPEWREVFGPRDVADFAQGRPVVLKPANRHASLGVQLLSADDDLVAAWETTVAARDDLLLPNRDLPCRYIAERRLYGDEFSVEALVRDGDILFLNVTAKRTAAGRYPVELGHVVPADLPQTTDAAFRDATSRLVGAVGFATGVLHAEWILDEGEPVLIECAGRLPGDSIVHLIDAAYGFDLVCALAILLAGGRAPLPDRARQASAIRFITADPGRVLAIDGLDQARARPGIEHASVEVSVGDVVGELRCSWDRVGETIATGATAIAAARRADDAASQICVPTADAAVVATEAATP